jgi:hypothetical protein
MDIDKKDKNNNKILKTNYSNNNFVLVAQDFILMSIVLRCNVINMHEVLSVGPVMFGVGGGGHAVDGRVDVSAAGV